MKSFIKIKIDCIKNNDFQKKILKYLTYNLYLCFFTF